MKEEYLNSEEFKLYMGDSLQIMSCFEAEMFDFIFADPPYFLSNDGITCSGGKMVSVNKGEWDKSESIFEIHDFNRRWLEECKRILKPNGTIMISGTFHNIYSIGLALQQLDYRILNNITWVKNNPPPNLACRYFTHSTETILWASKGKKAKHYFNYALMKQINNNKQMKDVFEIPTINKKEKKYGNHPTQKPIELMERLILAATEEGALCLDPFSGSGTTGIACAKHGRRYVGIELEETYLEITKNRFNELKLQITFSNI